MKLLSIIIANRNDTVMLSITVNSCIEELRPLGLKNCEIIICDNSDMAIYKTLNSYLPVGYIREHLVKVVRQDFPCLFSARETAIKISNSKYISCLDSHMLSGHDMFLDMVKFMESRGGDKTLGFAHAPINWAHHHQSYAKHDRDMSVHELGDWNKQYNTPRPITWKGMPWICTKDLWTAIKGYGALSDHRVSWGGGDMHIGIKPWLLGYKNWAVPTNSAIHIGPFPTRAKLANSDPRQDNGDGYQYRLYGNSGEFPHTFGFLVSCYVLGGEKMMSRNKDIIKEKFGRYIDLDKWWHKAMEIGQEEKAWLDANKKMSFEQLLETRPWEMVK